MYISFLFCSVVGTKFAEDVVPWAHAVSLKTIWLKGETIISLQGAKRKTLKYLSAAALIIWYTLQQENGCL